MTNCILAHKLVCNRQSNNRIGKEKKLKTDSQKNPGPGDYEN